MFTRALSQQHAAPAEQGWWDGARADLNHHLEAASCTERSGAEQRPAGISAAVDLTRHGILVAAIGGRIVQMNAAAHRLARAPDGLRLRGGRIQASTVSKDQELQAAITDALVRRDGTGRLDSYVVCDRPSGKRPYIVRTVPLDTHDDPNLARAAVVVIDPDQRFRPPKALLRQVFNLTEAEANVASHMLCGAGPQAIAEKTSVSVTTIKTQIQSIFRKTGTHRQTDLVRLLITLIV